MLTKKHSCMLVLVCAMISMLSVTGCAKKDAKQTDASKAPALAQGTGSDTVKKDSADLFDEFYNEKETGKGVTRGAKETSKHATKTTAAKAGVTAIPSADASAFDENGRFVVQISCVRSSTLADHLKGTLIDKGYPAYVSQVDGPTPTLSGSFYRVRIGNFRTVAGARAFAENALTGAGFEYWVDNKANDNVGISGSGFGSSGASGYESSGSSGSLYESTPAAEPSYSSTPEPATAPTPAPVAESKPAATESSSSWTTSTTESSTTPASTSTTGSAPTTEPAAEPAKTDNAADSWGNDSWGTSDTTKK